MAAFFGTFVLASHAQVEAPAAPQVEMTTGQGKTYSLTLKTLENSREYQYCELVFIYGEKGSDMYSTSPLAPADLDWWANLDLEALAKAFGAKAVSKNGPQWWSMDEVALMLSEPVNVAGVNMVYGGTLPAGTLDIQKYTVFNPTKFQDLTYEAGKPIYQLVDAEGHVYVVQGHKIPVERLATLGNEFKHLPEGWEYQVEVLEEELVMNLRPDKGIPSVQDEFDQIYIRIPGPAAPQAKMKTGQGKEMTLSLRTLPDSREYLYCELVFDYGDKGNDIYTTSHLGEPSLDWWNNLDLKALAKGFGAKAIIKNGPQWWSMDKVGLMGSEPVKVAGVDMVFGANLPPGTMGMQKYSVFNPAKYQYLTWEAGKPTYQLVDPDGHVYVVQGHKIPVERMATLGDEMKELPEGWTYRVVTLEKDLVMNLTPAHAIPSVQDEFDQIYIRIPEGR
jgi:hypothetical protein